MFPRTTSTVAVVALLAAPTPAQGASTERTANVGAMQVRVLHEPEPDAEPRWTAWVLFPDTDGPYRDSEQYLADLQTRWRDRQVAIAALLPSEPAKALARTAKRFTVAATGDELQPGQPVEPFVYVQGPDGDVVHEHASLDGIADVLEQCVAGELDSHRRRESVTMLASLVNNVMDGGNFDGQIDKVLAAWPRSGRARAVAVLNQWWCKGDLLAARAAVDDGIRALALESVPMAVFADLVLRGDRHDVEVARKIAMAMAPVAAGARDGVFTQLVYLRALLQAGQDRLAGRVAATLPQKLGADGHQHLLFAETLMEAGTPQAFRDLAERALAAAAEHGADRRWLMAARHKLLVRCGDDEAAAKLMAEYRGQRVASDSLNNDAWYLIVRPDSMGRFDTVALAQSEEMMRIEGDGLDFGSKDTAALAFFVNGHIDKAIELQTEASQQSGNRPVYVARLQRYRATRELLAEQGELPPKQGRRR